MTKTSNALFLELFNAFLVGTEMSLGVCKPGIEDQLDTH